MERPSRFVPLPDVQDNVGGHIQEERVVVDGFGTYHRQADLAAHLSRFIDVGGKAPRVIAHKSNRHEHHSRHAASA